MISPALPRRSDREATGEGTNPIYTFGGAPIYTFGGAPIYTFGGAVAS